MQTNAKETAIEGAGIVEKRAIDILSAPRKGGGKGGKMWVWWKM